MSQQNDYLLKNRSQTYGSVNQYNVSATQTFKEEQVQPQQENPNSCYNLVFGNTLNLVFLILTVVALVAIVVVLFLYK